MNEFALITGASAGIGKSLAHQFALHDYNLILVSDHEPRLRTAAQDIALKFPRLRVETIVKDLSRPESAEEIFEEVTANGISPDVLVNNVGVGQQGNFAETPLDKDVCMIRLNIEFPTRLTKLFLKEMLARGRGKILNLGSIAGFQPGPLLAVYHATKAYMVSFSEALAEELKDTGVTVTCLCPGPTATDFFERANMENTRVVQKMSLMDPDKVAEAGYKALQDGERVHIPGASNKVLTFMRRVMPESTQAKLNKQFYEEVPPKH